MRRKAKENCTDTVKARAILALGKQSSSAFCQLWRSLCFCETFARDATNHLHVMPRNSGASAFPVTCAKQILSRVPERHSDAVSRGEGGNDCIRVGCDSGDFDRLEAIVKRSGWDRYPRRQLYWRYKYVGRICCRSYCGSSWSRPITRRQIFPSFRDWDFFGSI
jgi:hypothetical protein